MMEKLLRRSWGAIALAVMFATAVSAQELASVKSNSANSMQTNSESFQERQVTGTVISGDSEEGLPGVNVIVKEALSSGTVTE